jgi:hypothetical protein
LATCYVAIALAFALVSPTSAAGQSSGESSTFPANWAEGEIVNPMRNYAPVYAAPESAMPTAPGHFMVIGAGSDSAAAHTSRRNVGAGESEIVIEGRYGAAYGEPGALLMESSAGPPLVPHSVDGFEILPPPGEVYVDEPRFPVLTRLNERLLLFPLPPPFGREEWERPRHMGRGEPMSGTSWLNRPYHVDWFVGGLFGDELIGGQLDQGNDAFGGVRLGWDCDHYWGVELRYAGGDLGMFDPAGSPINGFSRVRIVDLNVAYYPWGDARWRPYLTVGAGVSGFSFVDEVGGRFDETLLTLPFGFGLKYYMRYWLVLRADFLDNLALADSGLNTMHNLSVSLGTEIRWGARPRSYYPFHSNMGIW